MKKDIKYIDLDINEITYEEDIDESGVKYVNESDEYEDEYYEDEEESDEYEDEYYEDEEESDEYEDEYYEEEEESDEYEDEYYEEEEESDEYEDEYYEDEEESDEYEDEYYEDEEESDEYEDEYYEDEEDYEDNGFVNRKKNKKKFIFGKKSKSGTKDKDRSKDKTKNNNKGKETNRVAASSQQQRRMADSIPGKVKAFFKNFNAIDAIVAGTGVFVLVIAIVTVAVWGNSKNIAKQVTSMVDLGQQLSGLQVIGESNLLAIADAKATFGTGSEEYTGEPETEADTVKGDKEVTVNLTSVEKDLKIKFTGKESKKLISGTEFEVELTGPDKKTNTVTDDDKDGIIYMTKMTPGKYSVKVIAKDGYNFPLEATTVTVKDKIVYQKIEIADEVKKESEVNVAKEDTEVSVVEESKLKDTVEFVESTKTIIGGGDGYQQVDKSKITDPGTTSRAGGYARFSSTTSGNDATVAVDSVSLDTASFSLKVGETKTLNATVLPTNAANQGVVWNSSSSGVASVDAGTVTAVSEGSATITVTTSDGAKTATCNVTVTAQDVPVTGVTVSPATVSLQIGATQALTAAVTPADAKDKAVTWKSSAEAIAKVDASGTVTAVAAGTATITATTSDGGKTAACVVTVTAKTVAVTGVAVDPASKTLNINETIVLKANVAPADATDKTVTWVSNNPKIATVNQTDGAVKAVAVGDAVITATTKDGNKTATCAIKVTKTLKVTLDPSSVDIVPKNTIVLKPTATGFAATPTYSWATSDKSKATVDAKGKVTAVAAGKATITVTATDNDKKTATATCVINVKGGAADNKTSKLKDNDGNQLYVKDNGNYREAVFADYYTASAFYKKISVEYKYTGWQTIDNVTYFFNKNGDKITGTQVIKGVQYIFDGNGALSLGNNGSLGIDVSKWNGTINWAAVKNSGVSYVIIRSGYRGSSTGALIQDPKFQANIKGAQAAGLKVGIYFFTQAVNEVEAVEEASMVLNQVKGYNISYPIFIDTEGSGGRADGIDKGTRTAVCNAFAATIQNGGYKAGVYASKSWFETKLNAGALSGYKIWLAQYATKPTYGGRYDLWQYTSKGAVGGISGNVDLNISYLGY